MHNVPSPAHASNHPPRENGSIPQTADRSGQSGDCARDLDRHRLPNLLVENHRGAGPARGSDHDARLGQLAARGLLHATRIDVGDNALETVTGSRFSASHWPDRAKVIA
jgi:hypothetical protein